MFLSSEFQIPKKESNVDRSVNAALTEKEKVLICEFSEVNKEN